MKKDHLELVIHAGSDLTLHAGWWEESTESDGRPYRIVYPPEQPLFEQVLRHMEATAAYSPQPSMTPLSLNDQVQAILAVCLRWGSYFAVLADEAKPVWLKTSQQSVSMIADTEMARINIEASGALAWWSSSAPASA